MSEWLSFAGARLPALWLRTGEHILLTGVSTAIAIALGIPLGIAASRCRWLRVAITGGVGILQTIPSLAMLAALLALLNQIGTLPAIIALVLYALLPIVRNTLTGLHHVPPAIREAADGVGMTGWQKLWLVELPLAAPVIVTGIRTAAVVGVGIATLSAFIGAGGLGQFINRGLALANHQLILLGAVPSALLAMLVDASIGAMQWSLRRRPAPNRPRWREGGLRAAAFGAPLLILAAGGLAVLAPGLVSPQGNATATHRQATVHVGSKNFTEQLILGELMAQLIEQETDLRVVRDFDLGGTMICHSALIGGGIDLYAEYTGTALTAVLKQKVMTDPAQAYRTVARAYDEQFDVQWLAPFGFNNTYAITVRTADAQARNWTTLSDLRARAADLRAGWTSEFSERPDGYPGLQRRYGLTFGSVRDLDAALMYEAIERGEVDVICAFATDGRLATSTLRPLRDDRHFFPPYYAASVIREETLTEHPELRTVLNQLAGRLTNKVMQHLNAEVDLQKRAPADVAREFLQRTLFVRPDAASPRTGAVPLKPSP
jgi:osmoprotectant transport system permease protein